MKAKKALGGSDHDRLAEHALKKLEEKGVKNIVFEVNVSPSPSKIARIDILGFLNGKKIGVECYLQVQPKLITKRIPLLNVDELIFCVPSEREAKKLKSFNKEVWVAGFFSVYMKIKISEELDKEVREKYNRKRGDLSAFFEKAAWAWIQKHEGRVKGI